MSQTVGEGRTDRRARTSEKPFHTAWSGDMDPMRQRRGTQYFKVTQQHGTCSLPRPRCSRSPSWGIPLLERSCLASIRHSVSESPLQAMQKHLATLGLRRKLFFVGTEVDCVCTHWTLNELLGDKILKGADGAVQMIRTATDVSWSKRSCVEAISSILPCSPFMELIPPCPETGKPLPKNKNLNAFHQLLCSVSIQGLF